MEESNKVLRIYNLSPSLPLPKYATPRSSGFDLMACFDSKEDKEGRYGVIKLFDETNGSKDQVVQASQIVILPPGYRAIIPTGIKTAPDTYCHIDIRPRSGLAIKHGVTVLNTPGLVDEDYRGEIGVILINTSKTNFFIRHGDRIAQGVVMQYIQPKVIEVDSEESLGVTERADGGFGHSGR